MIRIAAFGDCHVAADTAGTLRAHLGHVGEHADLLCIAGDLTKCGTADEAKCVVAELAEVTVPIVAVLGNHDHHGGQVEEVAAVLRDGGVCLLEGEGTTVQVDGATVGIAGVKGFGGGFPGAGASEFGEPEMKAFVRHTKRVASDLERELATLDTDLRIALMHYAPVEATLRGERLEIYPFLGSYFLAEAVDRAGADLVLHGHAHAGREHGTTAGGIPVRNVAQPVIRHAYRVFNLDSARRDAAAEPVGSDALE